MYSIEANITKQNSPPGFTFPTLPRYEPQLERFNHRGSLTS